MVRELILAATVWIGARGKPGRRIYADARVVEGTQMRLNGMGLRSFSVPGIRIYVAGLYLEGRNGDPDTILHSQERKLLDIRFLRDVDADGTARHYFYLYLQNIDKIMQKRRCGITSRGMPYESCVGLYIGQTKISKTKGTAMSEELEFAGSVVGEKFCITLDDDFIEIEVDDPAEGIAISIKRADAIALAHAILRRYPTPEGSVLGAGSRTLEGLAMTH